MSTTSDARTTLAAFFDRFGSGDLAGVAALLDDKIDWNIPGSARVPWAGHRSTPEEVVATLRTMGGALTPQEFTVDRIVADGQDAVAVGRFTQKVNETGREFFSEFAVSVTVTEGRIIRYRIYEDSLAVAVAMDV
ncbi:nuclear transport factor 2 family protein [Streptosporangium canum]|uniref:nuclear transport factor 2 family protein n=1 Tax=Streptosporangium canum TaxID=324952 RepID=UPI0034379C63